MKYGRDILKSVDGYVPGEQPREPGIIKLNTNENPYAPSPEVLAAVQTLGSEALRKYPDPTATRLREAWAARCQCPGPEWVLMGNGMDELLSLALRTFVDPGDRVLAMYPTYSLYEVLSALHGAAIQYVDLDDEFRLSPRFFEEKARLCFLTRPNAPTGVSAPRSEIERLCTVFDGIVVIDEAYVDFADDDCMDFPQRFENAIVMRTFSKSFSLAGVRLGAAVANPDLIQEFMKVKDSYNVNAFTQAAGIAALEDYDKMRESVARVRDTRARLRAALEALGFKVPASQANFLLAQWNGTPNAKALFEALKARGILVRYFAQRRLEGALRITVGTDPECDALLEALHKILGR